MTIKNTIGIMQEKYQTRAKRVPVMPDKVEVDLVKDNIKSMEHLPIGIAKNDLSDCIYDFESDVVNLISANQLDENKMRFVYGLIEECQLLNNVHIEIVDVLGIFKKKFNHISYYNSDFTAVFDRIRQRLSQERTSSVQDIYMIIGFGELKNKLDQYGQQIYEMIFNQMKTYQNSVFLLIDNYASLKKIQVEQWYSNVLDSMTGIWLGEGVASQMIMRPANLSVEDRNLNFEDMAVVVSRGNYMIIKYIVDSQNTKVEDSTSNIENDEVEML